MNSKGQLFSLDLIIAIALVILAVGLLYRQAELFQYFQKDDSMQSELYRIGMNAGNQLVSNPNFACRLGDAASPVDYLTNCLPKTTSITKAGLGIPDNYDCSISINPSSAGAITGCNGSYGSAKNVFSIERRVVFLSGTGNSISKLDFDNCVKASCTALSRPAVIGLKVWKQ